MNYFSQSMPYCVCVVKVAWGRVPGLGGRASPCTDSLCQANLVGTQRLPLVVHPTAMLALLSTLASFLPHPASVQSGSLLHASPGFASRARTPVAKPNLNPLGESVLEQAVAASAQPLSTTRNQESCPVNSEPRSALILGWFFATERELQYVERLYKKNGFDEVVIQPSRVGIVSKPRGWYRSMRKRLAQPLQRATGYAQATASAVSGGGAVVASGGGGSSSSTARGTKRAMKRKKGPSFVQSPSELERHFDVVHCLSGGFLALYVLLRSGVGLRFNTLLCDSTPILPKPAAFTRFARAYMESVGLTVPLRLFPQRLHQKLIELRWGISIFYINLSMTVRSFARRLAARLRGRASSNDGAPLDGPAALEVWQSGPVRWGLDGDFDRVSRHALGTIFEGATACDASDMHFVYNPDDPFIDPSDVRYAAELGRACGLEVRETHVAVDHVKTLFAVPKTIFSLLSESAEAREGRLAAGAAGVAPAPRQDVIQALVMEGELPAEHGVGATEPQLSPA